MLRVFYCFGRERRHSSIPDPTNFFAIINVTDEQMKHRPLTAAEIIALSHGSIINLVSYGENLGYSMLVQKIFSEILVHQSKDDTIDLLARLLEGAHALFLEPRLAPLAQKEGVGLAIHKDVCVGAAPIYPVLPATALPL